MLYLYFCCSNLCCSCFLSDSSAREEDDELLQLAIQQSLMTVSESGTDVRSDQLLWNEDYQEEVLRRFQILLQITTMFKFMHIIFKYSFIYIFFQLFYFVFLRTVQVSLGDTNPLDYSADYINEEEQLRRILELSAMEVNFADQRRREEEDELQRILALSLMEK